MSGHKDRRHDLPKSWRLTEIGRETAIRANNLFVLYVLYDLYVLKSVRKFANQKQPVQMSSALTISV